MIKKRRQMAPTLDGIRDDHLERYRFAARLIKERGIKKAVDVGCGCGYGSYILATEGGCSVIGYDIDPEAVEYGKQQYPHENVHRFTSDLPDILITPGTALVMFEIIEHSRLAPSFLARAMAQGPPLLVCSVPNENAVPFKWPKVHPEHYRHYTPRELEEELKTIAGEWKIIFKGSQPGKHNQDARIVENDLAGRTLVFVAEPK
ncbi:MAG: methyltransferase domain-containing protein [Nitrospinaceae bacterium]|nr:class I SAM-dependent methyltransferase [Nitrospinaceae bacterium]NIR55604.1 class I SAM-dependent methyltransferase [Nitrospinaceae bacterium]NIS86038.1 class I SAM-dependent methyltransferase [Nitrospinaceae bacterium]NIT82881.1 class I SAM-dependent methyltransferase [Nitrospinaceae bacterium]NIU45086.1 class I SAM-dependent methyltransferase [Nitrospinaceae bacterium]